MRTGFPLDVCTLPGFCACLGIILSARGLAKLLLDRALHCFTCLNEMAEYNAVFKLLPNSQDCWVDVQNGCLRKEDLKRVLDSIGIDFVRPGLSKVDCFSKAHCSFEVLPDLCLRVDYFVLKFYKSNPVQVQETLCR